MKKTFFCLFSATIVFFSCSKSGGNTSNPPVTEKYMSTSAGSTWNYETVDDVASTNSSYTLTATNRDSAVNGKIYQVYVNSSNNAAEYYNISNNNYYSYQSLPASVGGSKAEVLYLKDNITVNNTWNQPFNISLSGVPVTITLTNKITEKNITRTVNGIVYNNVIHVQTSIAVSGVPPGTITSAINSYYAPKVGLIENTTVINSALLTIDVNTQTRLKTSNIL